MTGLAGMVAFNLILATFSIGLVMLFIFGRVLHSPEIEASVLLDLQRMFPNAEEQTIAFVLERIRDSSATMGIAATIGAIYIGASFWGAMDTAFCRIYHVRCRGWLEQKRFALLMLLVVVAFVVASVAVPAAEGFLIAGAEDLPFGLGDVRGVTSLMLLALALILTFIVVAIIYYAVPKGHVPWRAVWPGAAFVSVAAGIGNAALPFYLAEVSGLGQIGGAIGFLFVALIWFYLLSLGILAGAVINALRHEYRATGAVDVPGWQKARPPRRA